MTTAVTDSDTITFDSYQNWVSGEGFYPGKSDFDSAYDMGGITYTALGLAGEAGEVADKVKKILRDHGGTLNYPLREGLIKEMGDVLWYLNALANELSVTMAEVAQANIDKIEGRNARGTRSGEGDDR